MRRGRRRTYGTEDSRQNPTQTARVRIDEIKDQRPIPGVYPGKQIYFSKPGSTAGQKMQACKAPVVSDGRAIQPHPKEIRQRGFELYKQGKPFVDIAHELKIAAPTLRSWASREKWREQVKLMQVDPGLNRETALTLAIKQAEEIEIPESLRDQAALYEGNLAKASVLLSHTIAGMEPDEMLQKSSKIKDLDAVARKALKIEQPRPATVIQIGLLSSNPNHHRVGLQQD